MDSGLLDQFISEATDLTPSVDQRMLHQKDGVSVLAKKATGRQQSQSLSVLYRFQGFSTR